MPSFQYKRIGCFDNTELFSSDNENDYFPFHYHDFFCVSLITGGTEILKNTEQEFIASTGTISITQLNEVHRNFSLSPAGYSYKTIYVNPEILQHFSNSKPVMALERVIYDGPLFNNLLHLFKAENAPAQKWETCFRMLAGHATEAHPKNSWASVFYRIDEMIETYPNKPIDTDWLAKKFCMSKFHFIREFKKAKGVTPQTYIMLYRLGQSKKLLLQHTPLNDIAYTQGFCDPSHFTNSFKKYFGISPSRFVQP